LVPILPLIFDPLVCLLKDKARKGRISLHIVEGIKFLHCDQPNAKHGV
jgi:hypothetical protein